MTSRMPLCGDCIDGWLCDPDTGLPTDRCPCRNPTPTVPDPKTAALQVVAQAKHDQMAAAMLIIRDHAHCRPVLSANDVRDAMKVAQVDGPVVGAAFARSVKTGVLEFEGFTTSTDPGTHGHHIKSYRSRVYRERSA